MQGIYTILLLVVANIFMTIAWYGHLKLQQNGMIGNWPLYGVVLFSWMIALVEYSFQVPANRIGYIGNGGAFTLMQLKVIQEVITLVVFVVFTTILFKGEVLQWNHFAAFACLIMAVFFVFLK
ncbi:MAG: DMT family protein [Bacteroidales bacterium]|jgi:uncharacterized protein (DUF486 family)|nr:hypothetical protein [Bacteroidota bacterium]MCE5321652.1 DMT family protein [Bacteroidales bacterium]MDD2280678.1 DMT family protein [Bacteroidales bacterium]MDD4292607.1 DMT family protein [Bacteroidales bacterium]MDD4491587.1 DMT family protein [Bacteroidales bacterium]